jgi:hypothetical protein
MVRVPSVLFAGLILVPLVLLGYLHLRLFRFRRPTNSPFAWGGIRALRPDQYVDEGQDLLRWLWLVLVLTIPWWIVVFTVFTVA